MPAPIAMHLIFQLQGKAVADESTLLDIGAFDGACLTLSPADGTITVKSSSKTREILLTFMFGPEDTLQSLKRRIQDQQGIPSPEQSFHSSGKTLIMIISHWSGYYGFTGASCTSRPPIALFTSSCLEEK